MSVHLPLFSRNFSSMYRNRRPILFQKTRQHIFENKTGQPWLRTTLKFLRAQVEMKNPEHHAVAAAMIIPQIFMSAKSTPFPVVVHSALKP